MDVDTGVDRCAYWDGWMRVQVRWMKSCDCLELRCYIRLCLCSSVTPACDLHIAHVNHADTCTLFVNRRSHPINVPRSFHLGTRQLHHSVSSPSPPFPVISPSPSSSSSLRTQHAQCASHGYRHMKTRTHVLVHATKVYSQSSYMAYVSSSSSSSFPLPFPPLVYGLVSVFTCWGLARE